MTAQDLLQKIFEYQLYWAKDERVTSAPAKVRLAQIEASLSAFDLTKNRINPLVRLRYVLLGKNKEMSRADFVRRLSAIEYVTSGEFIQDRPEEVYIQIIEKAKNTLNIIHEGLDERLLNR